MGNESNVMCGYLNDNQRFADLFNGGFFKGQPVIRAEELREASEVYTGKIEGSSDSYLRVRDIKKVVGHKMVLRVLAVESQTHVDYTMPWRCFNYDSLEYGVQIKQIRKSNLKKGTFDTGAERLCGFKKSDRLIPVYTICLYHGEELWDGPRCLKDMMELDGKGIWENWFADYPMNLICINEQTDFTCYQTPLREVFSLLRYRRDKRGLKKLLEEDPAYQEMDEETSQVVSVLMGAEKFMEERERYRKEEKYNMCQALQEMMEDSRQEGREEGRKEGRKEGIRALGETCKDFGISKEESVSRVAQKFSIPDYKAEGYVKAYW